MDASKTIIANLALAHLGSTKQIGNLDGDRSLEGNLCRQFFDISINQTLSDFDWGFATGFAFLALIEGSTQTATSQWGYAYRQPADCLLVRRVVSGLRTDTRQSRAPFKIASDSAGKIIYTDLSNAEIEYTKIVTDTSIYPPDFIMVSSLKLASVIAPGLTAGDPVSIKGKMIQMYQMELASAQKKDANEQQADREPDAEYIRARGGVGDEIGSAPWRR